MWFYGKATPGDYFQKVYIVLVSAKVLFSIYCFESDSFHETMTALSIFRKLAFLVILFTNIDMPETL